MRVLEDLDELCVEEEDVESEVALWGELEYVVGGGWGAVP